MAIRSEQINVENNKLIIGSTVNSVNNVGVAMTSHADSEIDFSVDNTGTPGIKLTVNAQQIKGAGNYANDADSQILAGSVDTADVADDAITTDKIIDDAVTPAKISGADGVSTAVSYDFTGVTSFSVPTPVNPTDAATKLYVDDKARGLDFKDSVILATTSGDDLSGSAFSYSAGVLTEVTPTFSTMTIDGVTFGTGVSDPIFAVGDRILVKDRGTLAENGVYTLTQIGDGVSTSFEFTRAIDFDENDEITAGAYVLVTDGTSNKLTAYVIQSNLGTDPVLDSTTDISVAQDGSTLAGDITFVPFSGSATSVIGADGISVSGTTVSLDKATTSGLEFISAKLAVNTDDQTLEINGSDEIAVKIGGTNASLLYDNTAGSEGLAVKVDASTVKIGADGLTASVIGVGENDTNQNAVNTNAGSTGVTLVGTPAEGAEIFVFINGVMQRVGNGTIVNVDVFFMPTGSSNTADVRAFADLVQGDKLWFNPSAAGFDLTTSDEIRIVFNASPVI